MGKRKKERGLTPVAGGEQKNPSPSDAEIASNVYDLMEPLCSAEGVELVHVEYQREAGGRILRMYIDKPGGVTLNDCAEISRQAGDILDVHFDYEGAYSLEVSSPGADRPLAKLKDFEKFKGAQARIRTARPFNGQKNFKGTLLGVVNEEVKLSMENTIVQIPFHGITKARLVSQ